MAQVTIYMDNNLEKKIKELAANAGLSISKFIASTLEQKVSSSWKSDVKSLHGSWDTFATLEEIREQTQESRESL